MSFGPDPASRKKEFPTFISWPDSLIPQLKAVVANPKDL
jgi:hypothetical protein